MLIVCCNGAWRRWAASSATSRPKRTPRTRRQQRCTAPPTAARTWPSAARGKVRLANCASIVCTAVFEWALYHSISSVWSTFSSRWYGAVVSCVAVFLTCSTRCVTLCPQRRGRRHHVPAVGLGLQQHAQPGHARRGRHALRQGTVPWWVLIDVVPVLCVYHCRNNIHC
jgi:hypothetical protein